MDDQSWIALLTHRVGSVVMDAVRVECERREAEQEPRIRRHHARPCAFRHGRQLNRLGSWDRWPRLAIDDILLLVNAHFALLKDTVADGDEGERSAAPRLLNNVADHALAAQMRPSEHAPRIR